MIKEKDIIEKYEEFRDKGQWKETRELLEEILEEQCNVLDAMRNEYTPFTLKEGHVFDEEKSVRWNREEFERLKKESQKQKSKINEMEMLYNSVAMMTIVEHIKLNYDVNNRQAGIIYSQAYEDSHSWGEIEILYKAEEYAEFYERMVEASE